MESRFMPNLVLSANYLVSNPNFYNGISSSFSGMFSVGVGMNIPLFHFGDKLHTLRAAKSQYKITQYNIDEAKEKIELQVNQSNFRMTEANRKMVMCGINIDKANENLRFANEAFYAGIISSAELMEAQTAWLSANSEKIDSRIDVRLCELYLKKTLGNKQ
jgi:outer membrane protein TolC